MGGNAALPCLGFIIGDRSIYLLINIKIACTTGLFHFNQLIDMTNDGTLDQ